jgi:hypothetical protein
MALRSIRAAVALVVMCERHDGSADTWEIETNANVMDIGGS